MRQQPGKWWQRPAAFWDGLCALCERGLAWLLRRLEATVPPIRRRARLEVVELEPRCLLSNNPVANNDAYSVLHDHTLSVSAAGVLANDTDPNSYTLQAILVAGPSHGSVSLNANGSLTYVSASGYVGSDSFTYKDYDGVYYSLSNATVSLSVTDTAPVAVADSYSVHQGTTLTVSAGTGVLANDSDADGDTLHVDVVSSTSHGTLSVNTSTGALTYTPAAGFVGSDSFTYKDGDGAELGNTVTDTINVTDTAPVAVNDVYTVSGSYLSVSAAGVLSNDSDADGDSLHTVLVAGPAHDASFSLNYNGAVTYSPASGFAGVDKFTYEANDGALDSNTATVYIGVSDTAPTATGHSYVLHGGSLIVLGPGVLAGAADANGDSLFAVLDSGPSHGTLTLNADGSLSYTPNSTFSGSDSFTFKASDGVLTSSAATVSISGPDLTATGDTLDATAGIATGSVAVATVTDTDTALTTSGLTASVLWGDGTTATSVTSAGGGIVQNSDGTFTISAGHTYVAYGTLPVSVTAEDTVNDLSATATSTAVVADPVSLTNPGTQTTSEGATVSKSLTASDAISGSTLTFFVQGLPLGLAVDPSTGDVTGTVAAGDAALGPYSVDVTASDGTYGQSVLFTWNVSSAISLTNPGTQSNAEGDSVSLSLSATDSTSGATLTYGAIGLPAGLKINPSTGAITGTVAAGAAAWGPYDVVVTAQDGSTSASQEFTWNISSPVTLTPLPDQTSNEGDTVSLSVSASDSTSGATLSYTATGLPAGLKINTSTGAISGTIAAGASAWGPYDVEVTAGDGNASATQEFAWNVNSPVTIVTPDDQTNNEGDSVSLAISASDATSGATLTYGAVGLPAGLSIDAGTGAITGTIAAGAAAYGPYSVLLLAGDGTSTAQASFNWNVNSPISITQPDDLSNNTGDTVSLDIAATDSHTGTMSYTATGLPGGLSINSSSGAITGTLTTGGSFAPTVTASDGTYSSSVSFNWDVASPISITDPGPQTYNAGDAVSLPIQATDTVSGTLSYSASALPSGLSINSSTGLISGTVSTSVNAGNYASTVTVSDGTNTAQLGLGWIIAPTSTVVISNPGTQSSSEAGTVSLSLSASYSGSGTLSYAAQGLPAGLKINPSTGAITGTVAAGSAELGPYDVTVTASDGTDSDSQSFVWNVSSPITLTNPGTQSSTEGGSVSLSLSASYSGSGSLSYAAQGLPAGLSINPSTGAITGTVAVGAAALGPYDVLVQASAAATTVEQEFTWNIASPITLTAPADQTNNEGDTVSLSLSATDAVSGATLSYSATGLPEGLKINPSTGAITGTVALGAAALGPYGVTVLAQDGTYAVSQSFTWNVNSPVTIVTPDDQTNNEGDSVSLTLSATDATSGATLSYAATGLPQGLVINPSTGAISGTLAVGAALDGRYTVTINANDGTSSASTSFTWNVNSPITITQPDDQTDNAGDSVSLTISASGSGTLTYSATGLPNGLSLNSSTGAITGTLSAGGAFTPTITVGNGTDSNEVSFNWSVSSPILITDQGDQANSDGDTVSVQMSATDTASGTLSYSASGLPTGLSINSSTGLISGTISSGASASGPFTPTITVTDGTNTAVDSFEWDVSPAGPVVLFSPGDQSNTAGDEVAFFLQAWDNSGGTLTYTANGLPDGLYINALTGLIFGTVASDAVTTSPDSVWLEASDGSNYATQTIDWSVLSAPAVTLTNPGDQTNNEGDTVSLSLSGTDTTSGATLSYAAFGLPAGLKINPSTGAITGTVALGSAANGPYTVTVVANDGTNAAAQTFAWNVNNPVTLTAPDDQTNNEGDTVSLSVSATDSTSGATLSYAAYGLPAGLKINPSTGAITGTVAAGTAADGPYSVTVVAQDGSSSASQTFNWNVNSPITIATPDDQSNNEGDTVSLAVSATDATSGATLTYAASGLPAGLSINASTGVITGTVALGNSGLGSFAPTITVSDGTSSSSISFEWDVSGAVSIDDPGDQINTVGDTVSLAVEVDYTGSGTLVYSASGLPDGLSINASTGLISGTIGSSATAIGSFWTTITVGDGTSSASDSFNWTVSAAGVVTLATPATQNSAEGVTVSLSLSASDTVSGATLSYFAEGLPPGLKIDPSTGAITGTVAVGAGAYGPYLVTVVATDGTNGAAETFLWNVTGAVTLTNPGDQTTTEGSSVSLSLTANDTTSGATLVYAAQGLPTGLSINPSTGAITGTVAVGSAANGPYSVVVMAADGTSSFGQTFNWTINSPITLAAVADQNNLEGDSVSLSLSAPDSSSGTVTFAALGLPAGLKINPSTGAITGTLAPGTSPAGSYSAEVIASDGTYSTNQSFTWTVNDPITITDPNAPSLIEGVAASIQITASTALSGTLSYYAFGLPPGMSINQSTGEISGTPTNGSPQAAGSFVVQIMVKLGNDVGVKFLPLSVLAPALNLTQVSLLATPLTPSGQTTQPQAPQKDVQAAWNKYTGLKEALEKANKDQWAKMLQEIKKKKVGAAEKILTNAQTFFNGHFKAQAKKIEEEARNQIVKANGQSDKFWGEAEEKLIAQNSDLWKRFEGPIRDAYRKANYNNPQIMIGKPSVKHMKATPGKKAGWQVNLKITIKF